MTIEVTNMDSNFMAFDASSRVLSLASAVAGSYTLQVKLDDSWISTIEELKIDILPIEVQVEEESSQSESASSS